MNRLVIPLMLGLIAIARCESTATLTSIYTGSGFLPFATFYGSDPIYIEEISEKVSKIILKTNSLDINSLNATDFQCSLSKQVCLLAIDFLVIPFTIDSASSTLKQTTAYKIRDQSSVRIHTRIAFIEGSDYFISSSLSRYGIIRWKIGQTGTYSQLKFSDVSQVLETSNLLAIPGSKIALLSYAGYNRVIVADIVTMKEVRKVEARATHLAALTQDQSKGFFVVANEALLEKFSWVDGTARVGSTTFDYVIRGIRNVFGTDLVIIATWQQVFVINCFDNDSTWKAAPYPYFKSIGKTISSFAFSQSSGKLLFSGAGMLNVLEDTSQSFCHPFCQGCSLMLSEKKCTACKSPAVLTDGACLPPADSIKQPPSAVPDFLKVAWSEDNVKPAEKKFNIKDYYLYIIIGAGGLLGICCIYCLFKMCCGKSEEEKSRNQVHQRKDADYDD